MRAIEMIVKFLLSLSAHMESEEEFMVKNAGEGSPR